MSIDAVLSLFCMLYIQNLFHSTPAPHIQKASKIVKYLNVLLVVYAEKYPRYFTLYWYHTSPCCVLQTVYLYSICYPYFDTFYEPRMISVPIAQRNAFSYWRMENWFLLVLKREGGTGSFTISHIYNLVISIFIKKNSHLNCGRQHCVVSL